MASVSGQVLVSFEGEVFVSLLSHFATTEITFPIYPLQQFPFTPTSVLLIRKNSDSIMAPASSISFTSTPTNNTIHLGLHTEGRIGTGPAKL